MTCRGENTHLGVSLRHTPCHSTTGRASACHLPCGPLQSCCKATTGQWTDGRVGTRSSLWRSCVFRRLRRARWRMHDGRALVPPCSLRVGRTARMHARLCGRRSTRGRWTRWGEEEEEEEEESARGGSGQSAGRRGASRGHRWRCAAVCGCWEREQVNPRTKRVVERMHHVDGKRGREEHVATGGRRAASAGVCSRGRRGARRGATLGRGRGRRGVRVDRRR